MFPTPSQWTQISRGKAMDETTSTFTAVKTVCFNHVFFKENVRYQVWTCRDPISQILGTRIGSLKHLKRNPALMFSNNNFINFIQWTFLFETAFVTHALACSAIMHLTRVINSTVPHAVLPTLRFSREFGLVFCRVARFLKTYGLLVFGLVLIEICLFLELFSAGLCFADCFLFKFYGTFAV